MLASDELKAALAKAVEEGTVAEWAAAQGVEATMEELLAYAKAAVESGKISDEDLSKVAGGGNGPSLSVILALQNIGCPPDSK